MSLHVHSVSWDCDTGRPIVDGKTTNPSTGAVQPRGEFITYGPPTIQAIWHNIDRLSAMAFITHAAPQNGTIDELFVRVAQHVEAGLYSLVGVNATPYAFYILCKLGATNDEFGRVVFGRDPDPDQVTYTNDQGISRKIYFPLEKSDKILEFMKTKNWSELAKFPTSRPAAGHEGFDQPLAIAKDESNQ